MRDIHGFGAFWVIAAASGGGFAVSSFSAAQIEPKCVVVETVLGCGQDRLMDFSLLDIESRMFESPG
jgi:hypothetical protein